MRGGALRRRMRPLESPSCTPRHHTFTRSIPRPDPPHHPTARSAASSHRPIPSCAQVITGSAVYFVDAQNEVLPFWVFASDGISYRRAYQKQMLVIGPGQREGVLVQFASAGTVRVMRGHLNDFQVCAFGWLMSSVMGSSDGSSDDLIAFHLRPGHRLAGRSGLFQLDVECAASVLDPTPLCCRELTRPSAHPPHPQPTRATRTM